MIITNKIIIKGNLNIQEDAENEKSLECLYYIVQINCHLPTITVHKLTDSFSLALNLVLIYGIEAKHTLTVASKSTAVRSFFKASEFTIMVSSTYRKPFYTLAFSSPNPMCQSLC